MEITKRPLLSSNQVSKQFFHSQRSDVYICVVLNCLHYLNASIFSFLATLVPILSIKQFFTQSNPLNNLNITSSIVPPLLQRQNSAPQTQQQQQQAQQNQFNDMYKINNVNKPPITTASSGHQPELQRKYSLPVNSTPMHPIIPSTSPHSQPQQVQPPISIMRKQSAPAITPSQSILHSQSQQQSQIQQGSPNRARDRNLFDKVSSSQDVVQLPPLKGCFSMLTFPLISNY